MHLPSTRPEEKTIYEFTVSTWYTVAQVALAAIIPVIFILLAFVATQIGVISIDVLGQAELIAGVAGLIIALRPLASAVYLRLARRYFITTERVMAITGWLAQSTISIDYPTITDLTVTRDVFERFITQSGSLMIDTAGGPGEEITLIHVENPIGVRDQILELVEKAKELRIRSRSDGKIHNFSVAPSSAVTPIRTNPAVVDADDDGVIDTNEPTPQPATPSTAAPTDSTTPIAEIQ